MYKWHQYNLNVLCSKCNHSIPFQSFDGNPVCEECGTISDKTWTEAVVFSNIKKVRQHDNGSTQLGGFMNLQMKYDLVPAINCFHCHHTLEIPKQTDLAAIDCANCNHEITFTTIQEPELKNLFFYFHKNEKTNPHGNIIAVRCASCGAPLQADNTKHEYTCNFCSTLNIIPPALRAKKVLDDVFVGWNGKM
jgi:DNA-directed RNA polymerase subunit RPC12/RpoP